MESGHSLEGLVAISFLSLFPDEHNSSSPRNQKLYFLHILHERLGDSQMMVGSLRTLAPNEIYANCDSIFPNGSPELAS